MKMTSLETCLELVELELPSCSLENWSLGVFLSVETDLQEILHLVNASESPVEF